MCAESNFIQLFAWSGKDVAGPRRVSVCSSLILRFSNLEEALEEEDFWMTKLRVSITCRHLGRIGRVSRKGNVSGFWDAIRFFPESVSDSAGLGKMRHISVFFLPQFQGFVQQFHHFIFPGKRLIGFRRKTSESCPVSLELQVVSVLSDFFQGFTC